MVASFATLPWRREEAWVDWSWSKYRIGVGGGRRNEVNRVTVNRMTV